MEKEFYIMSRLAQAIKSHFPSETKQNRIQELLVQKAVNISKGMLSRIFSGSYSLDKDGRIFKELTGLLAPGLSADEYWNQLAEGFDKQIASVPNDNSAEKQKIKIGLSLKTFWARPFAALMITDNLPKNFEIVYGHRVRKTFNKDFHVSSREPLSPLSERTLEIPRTSLSTIEYKSNVSIDNKEDRLKRKKLKEVYDLLKGANNSKTVLEVEHDEWLLSRNLLGLLKDKTLDLIASPETPNIAQEDNIIPICRITAGYVAQLLIIESVPKTEIEELNKKNKQLEKAIEKMKDLIKGSELEKESSELKSFPWDEFILDGAKQYNQKYNIKEYTIHGQPISIIYNPYFATDLISEKSRMNYLDRLVDCLDIESLQKIKAKAQEEATHTESKSEEYSNYFWVRSIANTLSDEILSEFVNLLKQRKEEATIAHNSIKNFSKDVEIIKRFEDEEKKWVNIYELFSQRISKPISFYSEEILYKKQIKDRIVDDMLTKRMNYENNKNRSGVFACVLFLPYASKVLADILKYFKIKKKNENYRLKVNRFNLSNLLGKRVTTNLYARKDFLLTLIKEGRLTELDELYRKLQQAVHEMESNELLKRQLAFHHFYFENFDHEDEIERLDKFFNKSPEKMKHLLNEYESAETIDEFSYKIVRTDEYAKFLEEQLLAEKK